MKKDDTPIIVDVEASGFGRGSYPIEIGLALRNEKTFCQLIQPAPEWTHWDPRSARLHHIDREMLLEFGHPIDEVALDLNGLLAGETIYSDGWGFDQTWMSLLFDEAGVIPGFRIQALTHILSEAQMEIWDDTRKRIHKQLGLQRHRASNDARVLQLTWMETKKHTSVSTDPAAMR